MFIPQAPNQIRGRLQVAPDGHHLQYEDGTPFFYLGDTAWDMFHRLTVEEADQYLSNRAAKGFTVIQAVVLAERKGLSVPNAYGDLPLVDRDPTRPKGAYFATVDAMVQRAAELGLFIGMLPTWGNLWKRVGQEPPYTFDTANAAAYGRFLGQRYQDQPIIWILGGDRNIESQEEYFVVKAMAQGLREGDQGVHLITFHPRGPGLSSDYFHSADWLDFNMIQSSHGAHDHDNGMFVEKDYALEPPKPTVDGEPRYEHIPVGFYFRDVNRYDRMTDYDARQAAYWAVLAGACGHTYGNNNVFQMYTTAHPPAIRATVPWQAAIDHPGAFQMGYLRNFFERVGFEALVPDQSVILDGPSHGGAKLRAARALNGTVLVAYSPRGENLTINKSVMAPGSVKEYWFDPRYGTLEHFHTSDNAGYQTYTPPTSGPGQDWVLLLESRSASVGFSDAMA